MLHVSEVMPMDKHEIYFEVGDLVRQARDAARLTQAELAERIGLTRASVTNIEKARQKVQLHTLYAIAGALEVSVHLLLPKSASSNASTGVSPQLRGLIESNKLRPKDQQTLETMLASALPNAASDNQKRSKKTST